MNYDLGVLEQKIIKKRRELAQAICKNARNKLFISTELGHLYEKRRQMAIDIVISKTVGIKS